jgi:hypothetical protein
LRFTFGDVPRLRLAPLDLAGAGLAEALGRARMGLQLGHCSSRFLVLLAGRIVRRKPVETGTSLPS